MKRFIVGLVLGFTASYAQAQHYNHHRHNWHGNYYNAPRPSSWDWVAPAVIGGILVYGVTRPLITQPQPVYIERQVIVPAQAPVGYRWENVLDAACNCYRMVLVPNS